MFLCDERVLGVMPKLLGKMFFEAKKWVSLPLFPFLLLPSSFLLAADSALLKKDNPSP